ncbi:Uncharacterised protein [Yersinia enterocolitica]|nr:Uncharacterised protein [Yersinia enterocolitica]
MNTYKPVLSTKDECIEDHANCTKNNAQYEVEPQGIQRYITELSDINNGAFTIEIAINNGRGDNPDKYRFD